MSSESSFSVRRSCREELLPPSFPSDEETGQLVAEDDHPLYEEIRQMCSDALLSCLRENERGGSPVETTSAEPPENPRLRHVFEYFAQYAFCFRDLKGVLLEKSRAFEKNSKTMKTYRDSTTESTTTLRNWLFARAMDRDALIGQLDAVSGEREFPEVSEVVRETLRQLVGRWADMDLEVKAFREKSEAFRKEADKIVLAMEFSAIRVQSLLDGVQAAEANVYALLGRLGAIGGGKGVPLLSDLKELKRTMDVVMERLREVRVDKAKLVETLVASAEEKRTFEQTVLMLYYEAKETVKERIRFLEAEVQALSGQLREAIDTVRKYQLFRVIWRSL